MLSNTKHLSLLITEQAGQLIMATPTAALIGQAPINLGPLTTAFLPPPACTVAVGAGGGGFLGLALLGASAGDSALLGRACAAGKAVDASSCWPPITETNNKAAPSSFGGRGFYSPGVSCPVGYATACSAVGGSGGRSEWPVQFKLMDGETAVGCCPRYVPLLSNSMDQS